MDQVDSLEDWVAVREDPFTDTTPQMSIFSPDALIKFDWVGAILSSSPISRTDPMSITQHFAPESKREFVILFCSLSLSTKAESESPVTQMFLSSSQG